MSSIHPLINVKHIFIDSNIFLGFYKFGREDLEELNKLTDLIKEGEFVVYLTTQVCDEFYRNREETFKLTYKSFIDSRIGVQMNSIFKNYPEYTEITNLQKDLDKAKSFLAQKVETDMKEKNLIADLVVKKIFDVSNSIDSNQFLNKAVVRYRLGNPPGKKNNSYGDEINWEALLGTVPNNDDLILISNDGDYESPMFDGKLNNYLESEWSKIKNSKVHLYTSLSTFFKDYNIAIELKIENEKISLVEELINSHSFISTHEKIRKLKRYPSFSKEQIQGLATALLGNPQVKWIIEDKDVNSFYKKHFVGTESFFDTEQWAEIETLLFNNQEKDLISDHQSNNKGEIIETPF